MLALLGYFDQSLDRNSLQEEGLFWFTVSEGSQYIMSGKTRRLHVMGAFHRDSLHYIGPRSRDRRLGPEASTALKGPQPS